RRWNKRWCSGVCRRERWLTGSLCADATADGARRDGGPGGIGRRRWMKAVGRYIAFLEREIDLQEFAAGVTFRDCLQQAVQLPRPHAEVPAQRLRQGR